MRDAGDARPESGSNARECLCRPFSIRIGDHAFMSPLEPIRAAGPRVLTPSQLNRLARSLLEDSFAELWLEGEVSKFTHAASSH